MTSLIFNLLLLLLFLVPLIFQSFSLNSSTFLSERNDLNVNNCYFYAEKKKNKLANNKSFTKNSLVFSIKYASIFYKIIYNYL